jgi:signal transduction histidine kinase
LNRNGEELRDVSIFELFPNIRGMVEQDQRKGLDPSPDYQRYETLFADRKGNKIYLGFSISPLTAPDGSLIGHTLIFQDITKFKEMEDQMKRVDKMAALGVLASGMAHEIRNPLASLSGSIQILKSDLVLDQSQQRLMEITLRESERLNALITDFLLFAQPPQTHKIPCEMWKVIEETIEMFRHSPDFHGGIRIVRHPPPEIVRARLDPDQMKQVFWNLLINASQAMSDGGEISIQLLKEADPFRVRRVHLSSERNGLEWMRISITDSGNGIPPQEKEKIFEPFFTTKESGTGLGLSIVHKIVENHNGVIKVESEIGKGSTFTIYMPAEA